MKMPTTGDVRALRGGARRRRPRARGDARGSSSARHRDVRGAFVALLDATQKRRMADAVASVDPAALADVIRRCEAAVASWDPLGDIETRACLGKSADFPTAIRDAAPLVLAVERQLRDEKASRGDDAAARGSLVENLRVASRISDAGAHCDGEAHSVLMKPFSEKDEADVAEPAAADARRGATVVELCGPERGHLLGMLVRAMFPVEAVAEVVLVDHARPPRSGDADVAGEKNEPYAFLVGTVKTPSLTFHKANVKNGSHLRSLHEALRRRVTTNAESLRSGLVLVARRLAGTATSRACQLFDAFYDGVGFPDATEVSEVPVSLLLEPGDAPPMEASLKSKLLFRVARAHACAARQLYPAKAKAKSASAPRRGRAEPPVASGTGVNAHANDAREKNASFDVARRREQRDADAASRFFRHVVFGLRTIPGAFVDEFFVADISGETRRRFALARRDVRDVREKVFSQNFYQTPRDAFGPVAWTVTEQMAQLNAAVARRLSEADGYVGPTSAVFEKPSPNGGRAYFAFASPPRLLAGLRRKNADGGDENEYAAVAGFLLRRVAPSRWTLGGYADEHYVKPDPEPHGVCYEAVGVDARGAEILGASAVGFGFVSVTAHERGGFHVVRDTRDDDDDDVTDGRFGRVLTNAQIERLCVKEGARGVGVAQTLLRVADGFHACGVPARIKTASEKARVSFARMSSVLAFVGFKDPTTAGVSKSRGVRTVVVVDDVGREHAKEGKNDADGADRAAAVPPRWGADPGDARAYARRGWGKATLLEREPANAFLQSGHSDSDSDTRTRTRVDFAVRETTAAMNRAAPDTVDACAARVSRALSCGRGEDDKNVDETVLRAAAAAAGAAFARRAAREPTYAPTHAKVLRRVASAPFREKATAATLQTLRRLALASPPSRRSETRVPEAEGAAAFAAALTEQDTTRVCDQAERARVAGAVAAALARLAEAAGTGSSAATFALCVAVERGAMATRGEDVVAPTRARLRAIASAREDENRASNTSSAPVVLESGARFAAERALVALDRTHGRPPSESSALGTPHRLGFGIGRGRALPAAPHAGPHARAQSRAETYAAAEAEAAGKRRGNASYASGNVEGLTKRRVAAAPPLRVVAAGSVAAVERGMRQGWVFRYVGSAVAPRDEAYWTR